MTRTFGLIITLGALAVGGLVAAQNIGPSAQNVASPAPSAPGPAPGPEAGPPPPAGGGQKRIALVVGNSGYQAAPLKTAANDAGLIAQTLQAAGFDVVGARDLDQESTRRALRDFLDKAQASGPDTAAFVYLSGYGVQFEGDNYFVPIDAKLARAADVPVEAVRMSDYTRPLAAMNLKANIIVLDAGRANPFAKSGPPLAGGLALVDAEPGTLIAFNAAPGTVAPDGDGPYGAYAQALAEMIRDGGLQPSDIFNRVRLRVNETTKGAEVPWQSANIKTSFVFFERAADAPPPPVSSQQVAEVRSRSIREIGPQDAYAAALERDTLQGYTDFIAAYPDDPMAGRVRAIMAARREALTWRRTRIADTPDGYWSYLRRYPRGPHVPDAERRLAELQAALAPPPTFAALAYDVPPPPPDEIVYVDRPVLYFSDPVFAFAPPPPPPVIFLAPRAAFWVALPPPPPPIFALVLPIPVYQPIPALREPAGLYRAAAAQQHHLQQRPQHGDRQQHHQQRHHPQPSRSDHDPADRSRGARASTRGRRTGCARRTSCRGRSNTGRGHSARDRRTLATAIGRSPCRGARRRPGGRAGVGHNRNARRAWITRRVWCARRSRRSWDTQRSRDTRHNRSAAASATWPAVAGGQGAAAAADHPGQRRHRRIAGRPNRARSQPAARVNPRGHGSGRPTACPWSTPWFNAWNGTDGRLACRSAAGSRPTARSWHSADNGSHAGRTGVGSRPTAGTRDCTYCGLAGRPSARAAGSGSGRPASRAWRIAER